MSVTTIEQHHAKWSQLPTFAALTVSGPVTVEDVEFWCDLAYLTDLLDAIEDQAEEVDALLGDVLLDWPTDRAAGLIDDWRTAQWHAENPGRHLPEAVQ